MGHNPSTRSDKKLEKKEAEALRTPEQRLAAIRGSLLAKLFVIPDDVRFVLGLYDSALSAIILAGAEYARLTTLNASQSTMIVELQALVENAKYTVEVLGKSLLDRKAEIADLQAKNDEFRDVYDQENRSTTLTVERVPSEPALPASVYNALIAIDDPQVGAEPAVHDFLVDRGGEA